MTEKEFNKLVRLKRDLDDIKAFAYGTEHPDCEKILIVRLKAHHQYKTEAFSCDKEIRVPYDISDKILNIVREKVKTLQDEFDNFKTE